jgi:cysteine desulfurase
MNPDQAAMNAPVYLDFNATTPVAPEVLEAMLPYLREYFGNPSSAHSLGRKATDAIAEARASIAALVGARPGEIVLTGCATEASNLALIGAALAMSPDKRHLVISAVEHPAVMAPAQQLRRQGWEVTVVPVDGTGRVSVQSVVDALRADTALVSVMHANNEVGTLQPIEAIAELTRRRGILLHTDAAQSIGKVALAVDTLGVDLLSLAGHKFYAPKGVGALYVRTGTTLQAVLFGAEQERGLRPGTENVAGIVGLGSAAALAQRDSFNVEINCASDAISCTGCLPGTFQAYC